MMVLCVFVFVVILALGGDDVRCMMYYEFAEEMAVGGAALTRSLNMFPSKNKPSPSRHQ